MTRDQCTDCAIVIGCLYEAVALTSRKIPTITTTVRKLGSFPLGKIVVWAWCGYISWHFLEPVVKEVVS